MDIVATRRKVHRSERQARAEADTLQKDVPSTTTRGGKRTRVQRKRPRLQQTGSLRLSVRQARSLTFKSSAKKRFNVDSPSFTPASLAVNGNQPKPKATGISPKFANAAPFKPKVAGVGSRPGTEESITFPKQHQLNYPASTAPSSTSSTKGYNPNAPEWTAPEAQEYLPPSYNNAIPPVSVDWFSFLLPLSIAIRVLPSILCRCEVESTVEHQDRGTPLIHLHGRPFCHARRPSFDEVLRQCSNTYRTFSFGGTAFFAIVTPTP